MFNVQKCPQSHKIYICYNEYLDEEDDESIFTIEHLVNEDEVKEFDGIIDLITVKRLTGNEIEKIRQIHDILKNRDIKRLNVISDNRRILERIKVMLPDVSTKLLRIEKRR